MFNRVGPDGRMEWSRERQNVTILNLRYAQRVITHARGSWWHGVGSIVKINEKINCYHYMDILENKMEP